MPQPRKRFGCSMTNKLLGGLLICFFLGIALGALPVALGIEVEYPFPASIPAADQRAVTIRESMFKHGLALMLIWLLGFFPAGALGALALLLAKGAGLGFTAALFLKSDGFSGLFYMAALTLPQNLGMVPAYFFMCYYCLRFIFTQGGFFADKQTPPLRFLEYFLVLMICLGVTVCVSFYEAFAVPWLLKNLW